MVNQIQLEPTVNKMSVNTKDLDAKPIAGETVGKGGTGGKNMQAQ